MGEKWVCILAAGRGTRMGSGGEGLPKALIPSGGKAAITRIIESFSPDSHFVVALGHKGEMVREYLSMAHPKQKFTFVDVNPFSGPGSGPGKSVACCSSVITSPFYLVCCDTFWDKTPEHASDENWIGVGPVPKEDSSNYCNLTIGANHEVLSVHDKETAFGESFGAFTGLAYIKDYECFFHALMERQQIKGEVQLSGGFKRLIQNKTLKAVELPGWVDVGSEEKLKAFKARCEQSKFGKIGESLFFSGNRVVKFFSDSNIIRNRVERARVLKSSVPKICGFTNNFYAYNFVEGATGYEKSDLDIQLLLEWAERNLWKNCAGAKTAEVQNCALSFYRDKTFQRISRFRDRNPEFPDLGVDDALSRIDWVGFSNFKPVVFHGDFQLDNIIVRDDGESFSLIDWRHDFGGSTQIGDINYDLAKLRGSLEVNFSQVARGHYFFNSKTLEMELPSLPQSKKYLDLLGSFMKRKGIDSRRVDLLSALVFLNMAGLHEEPLDQIFYLYGSQKMEQWGASQNAQSAS